MINEKIEQIKKRGFKPLLSKEEKEREAKENAHQTFNLTIPFVSSRADKFARNIIRHFKKVTPTFKLNIAWRNLRLSNYFSPRLKLTVPTREINATVYHFECVCKATYIGQTHRPLYKRIYEHNRLEESAVFQHIDICSDYDKALKDKYGVDPTSSNRREFIESRFVPLVTKSTNYSKRTRMENLAVIFLLAKIKRTIIKDLITDSG